MAPVWEYVVGIIPLLINFIIMLFWPLSQRQELNHVCSARKSAGKLTPYQNLSTNINFDAVFVSIFNLYTTISNGLTLGYFTLDNINLMSAN